VHPYAEVAPFFVINYNPSSPLNEKSTMPQPLIGITSGYRTIQLKYLHSCLAKKYTQAIIRAGGIPLILPANLPPTQMSDLLPRLDGILFSGGDDVNPGLYGESPIPETKKILDERDELEAALLNSAMKENKPVLGICRGLQMINVALGGSLYQHILTQHPVAIQHDRHDDLREKLHHTVKISPGSHFAKILGTPEIKVNTLHHQGIRQLSTKLQSCGVCAQDGLIEAVEISDHPFFLAVQWHPEELADLPEHFVIFQAFVKACGGA
jgi:putative glutamine amidotransferase